VYLAGGIHELGHVIDPEIRDEHGIGIVFKIDRVVHQNYREPRRNRIRRTIRRTQIPVGNISGMRGSESICDSTHEVQPVTFSQLHVRIDESPQGQRVIVHENRETIIIIPDVAVEEFVVWKWVLEEALESFGMVSHNMRRGSGDEFCGEGDLGLIAEGSRDLPRSHLVPVKRQQSAWDSEIHGRLFHGPAGRI